MQLIELRNVELHEAVLPDLTNTLPLGKITVRDPISEPIFRLEKTGSLVLVCGRQLVADAIRRGQSRVAGKIIRCDDEEAERYGLCDEAWDHARRKDWTAYHRTVVRIVDSCLQDAIHGVADLPSVRGRRIGPRGRAERDAAELLGCDLRAVRRALRYAQGRRVKPPNKAGTQHPFRAFGLLSDGDEVMHNIIRLQVGVHHAATGISTALRALSTLKNQPPVWALAPAGTLLRAIDNLEMVSRMLRESMPTSLCPGCKGLEGLCETCRRCNGLGWIGDSNSLMDTPELLDESDPKVLDRGELRRVSEILEET